MENLIPSKLLIQEFERELEYKKFIAKFENSTSRELDKEFNKELKPLAQALSKLNKEERDVLLLIIGKLVEKYLENKVEKELENSFYKLMM